MKTLRQARGAKMPMQPVKKLEQSRKKPRHPKKKLK
jgi:hypothetical protein